MNFQALKSKVRSGEIDTVLVGVPDPFGRLMGKRFRADVFVDSIAAHGTHGCNYLLTVNMEMEPLEGFQVANWERDLATLSCSPTWTRCG